MNEPEVYVNGRLVGHGLEGMLAALPAMLVPSDPPRILVGRSRYSVAERELRRDRKIKKRKKEDQMAVKLKKSKLDRTKFLTNLVNKDKLTPHLERAAQEEFKWGYEFEPKEDDDAWHPSGHCTPPPSKLFEIATTEKDDNRWVNMYRTFQVGHFWHQYMQQLVLRLGFAGEHDIEREGRRNWSYPYPKDNERWQPKPYHWVRGFADVAPCVIPDHGEFVIDFKTMGNHDFKRAGVPYADKYECQLNMYMDFFEIERGLIIGIQKDTPHALKEFEFQFNQPLVEYIYQKWEEVSPLIHNADLSERELELELKELDHEFEHLPELLMGPIERA